MTRRSLAFAVAASAGLLACGRQAIEEPLEHSRSTRAQNALVVEGDSLPRAPAAMPPQLATSRSCVARGRVPWSLRTETLTVPGGAAVGRYSPRARFENLTVALGDDHRGRRLALFEEASVNTQGLVAAETIPIHVRRPTPIGGVVYPTRWTALRFLSATDDRVKAELAPTAGLPRLEIALPCADVTLDPAEAAGEDPFPLDDADARRAVRAGPLEVRVSPSDAAPALSFTLERNLAVLVAQRKPKAHEKGLVLVRIETPPPGPVIVGYVSERALVRNKDTPFFGDYIPPWARPSRSPSANLDAHEASAGQADVQCARGLALVVRAGGAEYSAGFVKEGARLVLREVFGPWRSIDLPGVFERDGGALLLVPNIDVVRTCR